MKPHHVPRPPGSPRDMPEDVTGGAAGSWNTQMPHKQIRTFDPRKPWAGDPPRPNIATHHPHDPKIKYIPSLGFHPAQKGDFNHVFPSQDMFDNPHWGSNCLSYLPGASTTSQFFVNMKQRMGPNGPCKLT